MPTTYCTAQEVANFMRMIDPATGVRLVPGAGTDPTLAEIEAWINMQEDLLDEVTNHAWREVIIAEQYFDYLPNFDNFYPREVPICLDHRMIRAFDHSKGDELAIMRNGSWVDLLDPSNGYTEGVDKDYWLDKTNGIVYLVLQRPSQRLHSVRVTYRIGEATVPTDIKMVTVMMTANIILQNDIYKVALPDGQDFSSYRREQTQYLEKQIKEIIGHHTEVLRGHP